MDNKLKEFESKYISRTEWRDIMSQSKLIKSDLEYLEQFINRNTTSKYGFKPTLTQHGSIRGHFIEDLWRNMYKWDVDDIEERLNLYTITCNIFEIENIDDRAYEIVLWQPVLEYFSNVNLYEHVGNFVGCSHGTEMLNKAIEIAQAYEGK